MKIKSILLLLLVFVLVGGNLFAANGDLDVKGNLIAEQGVTFSDGSKQTSATSLVWDYTVSSAITTASSPTLSGMAAGGYRFEYWVYNTSSSTSAISMYFNNDKVPTNYYLYGIGGGTATPPSSVLQNSSLLTNLAAGYKVLVEGSVNISPDGRVVALYSVSQISTDNTLVRTIEKIGTVADLTKIDIVSEIPLGIGVNSRFRLWRRN